MSEAMTQSGKPDLSGSNMSESENTFTPLRYEEIQYSKGFDVSFEILSGDVLIAQTIMREKGKGWRDQIIDDDRLKVETIIEAVNAHADLKAEVATLRARNVELRTMLEDGRTPLTWQEVDALHGQELAKEIVYHVNDASTNEDAERVVAEIIRTAHSNDLAEALQEAKSQIEYLHEKFTATGSGNAVLARINNALAAYEKGAATSASRGE